MIATATEPPNAPPTMAPRFGVEELEEGLVEDGAAEPDNKNGMLPVLATVLVEKSEEGRIIETT
jgi:hypothetical protein